MNYLLAGTVAVTTASTVTGIVAAAQENYGVCAVALFTVAADAVGAYLVSRFRDAATDRAVPQRRRESPRQPVEALANELGLRPAAVRLSIRRLTKMGVPFPGADTAD
ncbi:Lrp/AsnC family transcriptional regulator [Streptomyces sp. NPDC048295]|uniref:winged helix-turn-helix domain-containing protein n=1 Tax=Streptomyces sp. NPDC048295 TaxID=3154617 RepID=UPI00343B02AF